MEGTHTQKHSYCVNIDIYSCTIGSITKISITVIQINK